MPPVAAHESALAGEPASAPGTLPDTPDTAAATPREAVEPNLPAQVSVDASAAALLPLRGHRGLSVLAVGAALVLASWLRPLLVPILIALLLALTLAPALRVLVGARVPRMLAAAALLGTTILASAGVLSMLWQPAQGLARDLPAALKRLELLARQWRQPLDAAGDAAQRLIGTPRQSAGGASSLGTGVSDAMLDVLVQAPLLAASAIAVFFLAFMMLAHGDALLRKLVTLLPSLSSRKDLIAGTREAQRELSRYLLAITCINLALGIATALVLTLLGVDNAILWGGIAALANYAPYVGPALITLLLVLVGFAQHAQLGAALAVPASFMLLTAIEGQIISPLLVGRRLHLDPLVIVLALVVLGWLWGVAGLLIAVPLLTCLRVVAQRWSGGDKLVTILTAPR
jgi:predicted PurR-regulated permease PerM